MSPPNAVRVEVEDHERSSYSRNADPLFGNFPSPRPDNSLARSASRPGREGVALDERELEYPRRERPLGHCSQDEYDFFYSRYEGRPGGGWRRFRVSQRRTLGELLSDAQLDGYNYALIPYGDQFYALRRGRGEFDDVDQRREPLTLQKGRMFVLREPHKNTQQNRDRRPNEREGGRLASEIRAWFTDGEPMFRGRRLLGAERKLERLSSTNEYTIVKFNDVNLETVNFEELEAKWTRRQASPVYGGGSRPLTHRGSSIGLSETKSEVADERSELAASVAGSRRASPARSWVGSRDASPARSWVESWVGSRGASPARSWVGSRGGSPVGSYSPSRRSSTMGRPGPSRQLSRRGPPSDEDEDETLVGGSVGSD